MKAVVLDGPAKGKIIELPEKSSEFVTIPYFKKMSVDDGFEGGKIYSLDKWLPPICEMARYKIERRVEGKKTWFRLVWVKE